MLEWKQAKYLNGIISFDFHHDTSNAVFLKGEQHIDAQRRSVFYIKFSRMIMGLN